MSRESDSVYPIDIPVQGCPPLDIDAILGKLDQLGHNDIDETTELLRQASKCVASLDSGDHHLVREKLLRAIKGTFGAPARVVDDVVFGLQISAPVDPCVIDQYPTETWPDAVDGAHLLREIEEAIERYLILPKHAVTPIALWIVHTHCLDSFEHTPRLAILSPEKRCGKTRVLEVIERLAHEPIYAANVTAPVVFRLIEARKPTFLIDEADTFLRDSEELRGVLNAGHKRGGAVYRCEGDTNEPVSFDVFGPVAVAAIGSIADTLLDRSVRISMSRKVKGEAIERLPRRRRDKEFPDLRLRIVRWASDRKRELEEAEPQFPEALNDREIDSWTPLLAIADAAGEEWPGKARQAATHLASGEIEAESLSTMLLHDVRQIFKSEGDPASLASQRIVAGLATMEDRPWPECGRMKSPITPSALAKRLRPFRVRPRDIRSNDKTLKGYRLEDFEDAFRRYL